MREIPLTKKQVAICDDCDLEMLVRYKWHAIYCAKTGSYYAASGKNKNHKRVTMSRLVMRARPGEYVDHVNHDTLNNTRNNLRICTSSQNSMNRKMLLTNKSGYKGVWDRGMTWQAIIKVSGKINYLGSYRTPVAAALAYNIAATKHFGEYAYLNGIPD